MENSYWNKTSSYYKQKDFEKITNLLNELYPSDPGLLIHAYLNHSRKGKEIFNKYFENKEKDFNIREEMKNHLDTIKLDKPLFKKDKNLFIYILCKSKFTREEIINSLNITLSKDKFNRIRNEIPLLPVGKKPIDKVELTNQIKEWAEKLVNDNIIRKTVQTYKRIINKKVEYIHESKLCVTCCFKYFFKEFINDTFNAKYSTISYITFLRNIPQNIILPSKKTDLCELCWNGKKIEKKEVKSEQEMNLLLIYNYHKENAFIQRMAMKSDIENLKEHEAVLILDFKQNIKLGGSPEEKSREFYQTTSINYLSIFMKTKKSGIFFDFTSLELSKDSYYVIECFDILFGHLKFKELEIRDIVVWSDTGKHFKNSMIACYFANIFNSHKLKCKFNYFVDSHGKNICDVHFSMVSHIVEKYEKGKAKIKDISDLNNILESEFEKYRIGYIESGGDLSPIPHELDSSFNFSDIQEVLQNISSFSQVAATEYEYEEDNSEEELEDITFLVQSMIEEPSVLLENPTVSKDTEILLNSNTSNQSFVLEIKNYPTLLIEKKPVIRKPELEMLKFPQLMIAYHFDYSRYITENKILYSVLSSSETKLEVPTNQIKVDYKKMKPSAKKAIIHKETKPEDMVTRRRILLMKGQLGLQKKPIPESINLLSIEYLKKKRKKSSKEEELTLSSSEEGEGME